MSGFINFYLYIYLFRSVEGSIKHLNNLNYFSSHLYVNKGNLLMHFSDTQSQTDTFITLSTTLSLISRLNSLNLSA